MTRPDLFEGSYQGGSWLIVAPKGHPYSFISFLFGRQLKSKLAEDSMEGLSGRALLAFS